MLDSLYQSKGLKGNPLFDGYNPPSRFVHGKSAPVARFDVRDRFGMASEMSECRWPAGFYQAITRNEEGREVLKFGTGSGSEIGRFLAKLLLSIAEGRVCVDYGYDKAKDLGSWEPQEDGRAVTLRKTDAGFFELEVAEGREFTGRVKGAVWLYFEKEALARETAKHVAEGMLDIE
jgi:hypothetical protein